MSLRGLLSIVTAAILVLSITISAALVLITKQMEHDSFLLWQTVASVHAAEEIEVSLLTYSREHRLFELTRDQAHATEMRKTETELQSWLEEAGKYVESAEEGAILESLRSDTTEYLELVKRPQAPEQEHFAESPLLKRMLRNSEKLIDVNIADAQKVKDETGQWDELANHLGILIVTGLFIGLGGVLWSTRRYAYRPLVSIRNALVHFRPGTPGTVVPEAGPLELRDIAHEFNEMARRLERNREVQLGFIAGVAHDLRNPLSALKLSAATIRPDRPLPPEDKVRDRFTLVVRQVERIERMVEDLLDTARIEAGRLELRPEEQDLRGLLQEVVALHDGTSSAHALVLQMPEEPVMVRYDTTRISQVLNNLLSNAIKYSPQGGQVRVELTTTPDTASVAVTDSGVGIPAEELESIFEPFRRGSTTRDTIPGVGLGLAVGRRIIEAHGGHIEVESKPGAGSTFRFRLPRAHRG